MSDLQSPVDSEFVAPPSPADISGEYIGLFFHDQNATLENIRAFVTRWPPSKTPVSYCQWIEARRHCPTAVIQPHIESMLASFQHLVASNDVTVATLDHLAKENNVLSGKWLIFADVEEVDTLWEKVVQLVCLQRKRGFAKVSPNKDTDEHVICVYVDDVTNHEEVQELRAQLRTIGVQKKIGFKLDAYTHLGIYARNPWGIRPNRYFE